MPSNSSFASGGRVFYILQVFKYFGIIKGVVYILSNKLHLRVLLSIKIRNKKIYIRTNSPDFPIAIDNLINGEFKELPIKYILEQEGGIIDGGSYIGTSALALHELFPEKRIICVEPHLGNFKILHKNTKNISNIEILNAALAPKKVERAMLINRTREYGFTIVSNTQVDNRADEIGYVECVNIEDLMILFGFDNLALLKLDVEGGEMAILDHSEKWISSVSCVYIELHDRILPGCTESFLEATKSMNDWSTKSEKLCKIRHISA